MYKALLLSAAFALGSGSGTWSTLKPDEAAQVQAAAKSTDDGKVWKAAGAPKSYSLTVAAVEIPKDAPLDLQKAIKATFNEYASKDGAPGRLTITVTSYETGNGIFGARATAVFQAAIRDKEGNLLYAFSGTVKSKSSDWHSMSDSDSKIVSEKLFKAVTGSI